MQQGSQEAASRPEFPLSSNRPGQGTVYNCPDHGPMGIEYSGGAQRYECLDDPCGYTYDPERDNDAHPEVGRRHPESPARTQAAGHPVALAQAFNPTAGSSPPSTAPPSSHQPSPPSPPAAAIGRSPRR